MSPSVVERIRAFNEGRIPEMRARKYHNMRANSFVFYRGTSHLFFEDWPAGNELDSAPLAWACGDLHLENFGTFKGADRRVYFDINDFDDAALAPASWDLTRLVTSLILAGEQLTLEPDAISGLCKTQVEIYFGSLGATGIRSIERDNATGMIKKLMDELEERKRAAFLDEHTHKNKDGRVFKLKDAHFRPVSAPEYEQVSQLVQRAGKEAGDEKFFRVRDVVFRIAGTGSLGVRRYAALIEGRGSPDDNFILDIKQERPSALLPYLRWPQPAWEDQASRAISIQRRMQASSPALLSTAFVDGEAFLVRELQPVQDRINLVSWDGKLEHLEKLAANMAEIIAWGQLRGAGLQGAAALNTLSAYGKDAGMAGKILTYAHEYAGQVRRDYALFCGAYDAGELG